MSEVEEQKFIENYFIFYVENCNHVGVDRGRYYEDAWDDQVYASSWFRLNLYRKFVAWFVNENVLSKLNEEDFKYSVSLASYDDLSVRDQWIIAELTSKKRGFIFVDETHIPQVEDMNYLVNTLWRWVTFKKLVEPVHYDYVQKTGLDKVGYSVSGSGLTIAGVFATLGLTGALPVELSAIFGIVGGVILSSGVPFMFKGKKVFEGVTGAIRMSAQGKKWVIDNRSVLENVKPTV